MVRLNLDVNGMMHSIDASEQRGRDVEAERFGGFEVDDQLVFGRLLHRQVGGFGAL